MRWSRPRQEEEKDMRTIPEPSVRTFDTTFPQELTRTHCTTPEANPKPSLFDPHSRICVFMIDRHWKDICQYIQVSSLVVGGPFAGHGCLGHKINHSAKYTNGDNTQRTQKSEKVSDYKAGLIVNNMQIWFDDKCTTTNSRFNMIVVANVKAVASKGLASEQIQEIPSIVNSNIKNNG